MPRTESLNFVSEIPAATSSCRIAGETYQASMAGTIDGSLAEVLVKLSRTSWMGGYTRE
jgi:hypothetical protein